MAVASSLSVILGASLDPLKKGLKKAKGLVSDFGSQTSKLLAGGGGIGGAIAGAVGGVSVIAGLKFAVGQFQEIETASTRLQASLTATGNAAGVTVGQVVGLARELSQTTQFSAAATTQAAAALARFSQIKGANFTETIKQGQNLAAVLGKDVVGATTELGHALRNPAEGYLELAKQGVLFSDAQIDAIQSMQAAGDIAGAQGVILEALKAQMGSAAEEAGGTLAGSFAILHNSFSNVAAIVGEAVAPAIKGAVSVVADWAKSLDNARTKASVFEFVAGAAGIVSNALWGINTAWQAMKLVTQVVLTAAVGGIYALVEGLNYAIRAFNNLGGSLSEINTKGLKNFMEGSAAATGDEAKKLAKMWGEGNTAGVAVDKFFREARQKSESAMSGITEDSKKAGDAIKAGPVAAMKQLSDRAIEAQSSATAMIREMKIQLQNFGMDDYLKKAKELEAKGATKGQVADVKRLGAQLKGKELAQSLETPFEKFKREMKKLSELNAAGGLDKETFIRARSKLTQDLMHTLPNQKYAAGGALKAGSQEARSAIMSYRAAVRGASPQVAMQRIAEQQLEEQRQARWFLQQMAKAQPVVAQFAGL